MSPVSYGMITELDREKSLYKKKQDTRLGISESKSCPQYADPNGAAAFLGGQGNFAWKSTKEKKKSRAETFPKP